MEAQAAIFKNDCIPQNRQKKYVQYIYETPREEYAVGHKLNVVSSSDHAHGRNRRMERG